MNLAIAVVAGVLVAVAIGCVRQALRPPAPTPRRWALAGVGRGEAQRLAVAIGCAVVVLLVSGWVVAWRPGCIGGACHGTRVERKPDRGVRYLCASNSRSVSIARSQASSTSTPRKPKRSAAVTLP